MAAVNGDGAELVRIESPKLLLVEGESEYRFFRFFLENLDTTVPVQIANFKGIGNLKRVLRALPVRPEYPTLESIGVTRDADKSSFRAFQSVCSLLESAGLGAPDAPMVLTQGKPRVAVYVLPDCSSPGSLESLCLTAVACDPAMQCVEQYVQCLEETARMPHCISDKARAHAFLASRPKPELRVGEAAEAGHWNLDSQVYESLKSFLLAL
ncbi:MAG: hypothetical protein OXM03_11085 [Chloroflexota bacterium]|nr:hypothetical protein [Chloroflexota bacterium]MDE2841160.1 hypothetical protein [Chloroflexota bacterium]MDE2931841.1 hypothetical protein [Chloroflexota bacterium]